jgi:hypothetical protein
MTAGYIGKHAEERHPNPIRWSHGPRVLAMSRQILTRPEAFDAWANGLAGEWPAPTL